LVLPADIFLSLLGYASFSDVELTLKIYNRQGDNWENKKAVATRFRDTFSLAMVGHVRRHRLVQEMVSELDLFSPFLFPIFSNHLNLYFQ